MLLTGITPLIVDAKAVATNPSDRSAQRKLRESTKKVSDYKLFPGYSLYTWQ